MPSLEEAREQAWRKLSSTHPLGTAIPWADGFDLGYKAGREKDEQRIAALVAALEEIEQQPGDCDCVFIAERALAGQTEESK